MPVARPYSFSLLGTRLVPSGLELTRPPPGVGVGDAVREARTRNAHVVCLPSSSQAVVCAEL